MRQKRVPAQIRFFSTITALLQTVIREWERKVGPLQFNLDSLRAADEVSRARAVGSQVPMQCSGLVQSGRGFTSSTGDSGG